MNLLQISRDAAPAPTDFSGKDARGVFSDTSKESNTFESSLDEQIKRKNPSQSKKDELNDARATTTSASSEEAKAEDSTVPPVSGKKVDAEKPAEDIDEESPSKKTNEGANSLFIVPLVRLAPQVLEQSALTPTGELTAEDPLGREGTALGKGRDGQLKGEESRLNQLPKVSEGDRLAESGQLAKMNRQDADRRSELSAGLKAAEKNAAEGQRATIEPETAGAQKKSVGRALSAADEISGENQKAVKVASDKPNAAQLRQSVIESQGAEDEATPGLSERGKVSARSEGRSSLYSHSNGDASVRESMDASRAKISEEDRLSVAKARGVEQAVRETRMNEAAMEKAATGRAFNHSESAARGAAAANLNAPSQQGLPNGVVPGQASVDPKLQMGSQNPSFDFENEGRGRQDGRESRRSENAGDSFGLDRSAGPQGGSSASRVTSASAQVGQAMQRMIESIDSLRQNTHQNQISLSIDLKNGETMRVSLRIVKQQVKAIFSNESEAMRIALRDNWDQLQKLVSAKGLEAGLPEFEGEQREQGSDAFKDQQENLDGRDDPEWSQQKSVTRGEQKRGEVEQHVESRPSDAASSEEGMHRYA